MKTESKTLGILGGGQLGRMSALAAAKLGINVHIYCPDNNSPASHTSSKTYNGSYTNKKLLKAFCDEVDVVTYEFENIPLETVLYIQKHKPVFPDNKLLEISQHRLTEKQFLNDIGIMTPKWSPVNSYKEIETAANDMGCSEFILKTTRFGYDGKGQVSYALGENCKDKWKQLKTNEIIIEEKLDFACEISVIIARDKLGQTALYGPILNEHKNHILYKSTYPAPIPEEMSKTARDYTLLLAEAVDLVGVLALEMFITKEGKILANEIAPRTHNSGHYSMDACTVSQFEQHVRTVCGMPVAPPGFHSDAIMINLIGKDVKNLAPWLESKGSSLHLYGKDDIKEGRKMGHVTQLKSRDLL